MSCSNLYRMLLLHAPRDDLREYRITHVREWMADMECAGACAGDARGVVRALVWKKKGAKRRSWWCAAR